jgi:hypothetical protein
MLRSGAVVLLAGLLAAGCGDVVSIPAARSAYSRASVSRIVDAPQRYVGVPVITYGRYERVGPPLCFVEGALVELGARLRVMGPAFDWIPHSPAHVEFWGRIRRDRLGPYLYFFNGRLLGQTDRRPHVTPPLVEGGSVALVAKLGQAGGGPFVRWVLGTEDRKTVEVLRFPPGFRPLGGLIVEAAGVVRSGGIPPVVAGLNVDRIRVRPAGPCPF